MDFSLSPEQYAELARYTVVMVILGIGTGWALARTCREELPQDEEQDDQRSQRGGRY